GAGEAHGAASVLHGGPVSPRPHAEERRAGATAERGATAEPGATASPGAGAQRSAGTGIGRPERAAPSADGRVDAARPGGGFPADGGATAGSGGPERARASGAHASGTRGGPSFAPGDHADWRDRG